MLKEISIEITRKCPNACLHCSSLANIHCKEMITFEKFNEVIQDGLKLGLKTVCLSGGEPFVHEDILKIIDSAYQKGLDIYVYTSGILLDENGGFSALSDDICRQIKSKVTKLIFNVEAAKPEIYNQVMGTKGCFPILLESIKTARKHGICVEAHFVPMKLNVDEIKSVVELGIKMDIQKISFLRLVTHGRAEEHKRELELNELEFESLRLILEELKTEYKDFIRIGVPLSINESEHKCEAARGKLNIRYDGKIFPCEVFKNKQFSEVLIAQVSSIYDNSIEKLYYESSFLKATREGISSFENSCNGEKCYGQYLIDRLNIIKGDN